MKLKWNKGLDVALIVLLCSVIAAMGFYHIGRSLRSNGNSLEDAPIKVDTVWLEKHASFKNPTADNSIFLGYIRVKTDGECNAPHRPYGVGDEPTRYDSAASVDVAIIDTTYDEHDIQIPIMQRMYRDSLYTAWVSGYCASLDSIQINIRSPSVIQTKTIRDTKKWGFGIQGGVGITPKGIQPYIGLGLQFKIH